MPSKSIRVQWLAASAQPTPETDMLILFDSTSESTHKLLPTSILAVVLDKFKPESEHPANDRNLFLPTFGQINCKVVGIIDQFSGNYRKLGDLIALAARKERHQQVTINLSSLPKQSMQATVRALCEGLYLANYERMVYQHKQPEPFFIEVVTMLLPDELFHNERTITDLEQAVELASIYSEAVCLARDLTNLPGNYLVPQQLAEKVVDICSEHEHLSCEILDEQQLAAQGMGGLLAVGKGSVHPPRMITVHYRGNPDSSECLGIVGKGITFDTGGISLKRSDNMDEMICDMAGAAAVIGTMLAIGKMKPQCNLVFVIASAENMPAGNAYKPGDIVTTLSGKTIEVLNTDAEGRVVLADAMTYALQQGATQLIDLATLTGAILVCLADVATGAVTNHQEFLQRFLHASEQAGERVWQLPVYPEYKEMIKSKIADVKNTGGRYAGSITGGLFIGTFAEQTPWIHLDIAGTAFLDKKRDIHPIGGTGVMVRSLLTFIELNLLLNSHQESKLSIR